MLLLRCREKRQELVLRFYDVRSHLLRHLPFLRRDFLLHPRFGVGGKGALLTRIFFVICLGYFAKPSDLFPDARCQLGIDTRQLHVLGFGNPKLLCHIGIVKEERAAPS